MAIFSDHCGDEAVNLSNMKLMCPDLTMLSSNEAMSAMSSCCYAAIHHFGDYWGRWP